MPRICVFPYWNTNPYINMLYLEARAAGWGIYGRWKYPELITELGRMRSGDVLHVHWTSPFADRVTGAADYRERIEEFRTAMGAARDRGVHLVWTVHNAIAHDTAFLDEEVALARCLSELATRIVILNSSTVEAVADYYELPAEKVHRIPHASYAGVYAVTPSRAEARRTIGVAVDQFVVGLVGGIRPYKGVGDLLQASQLLAADTRDVGVLLAGSTTPEAMDEIEANVPYGAATYRRHGFLDDTEIVTWSAACDVLVFPYTQILNSGSIMLASTVGVPCVVPDLPHLVAEYGDQPWIEFFDAEAGSRPRAIADALATVRRSDRAARGRAALEFAREYTMVDMAWAFADLLDRLDLAGVTLR